MTIRSASMQVTRTAPKAFTTRGFALGDTLNKKEKVEEDRYMRALEQKYIEKKRAEATEKMHEKDEQLFAEEIAPAMAEAEVLLSKSGDNVSSDALESLAKWKVGL
eukprot:CAMPEP_0172468170 /NCGR_PEP_ID=MMETSP1065-20121228/60836_1 /TAXON_ID=265537 /ORGANISM="Amphiprora paludosa, Strain CCMP125" /LENGTH=105 /DNA_ID=CAMNT_0013225517 /DNA_START=146 /DNA_END=463 /DNA_ORIENTATION=+